LSKDECFREPDVIEAVRVGEWPHRCEPALREHVRTCRVCSEVLAVSLALQNDAEESAPHVRLPTAAHVWWRAGIRARQDAAIKASRPISVMEGFAAASGVGLGAAAIALGWSAFAAGLHDLGSAMALALAAGGIATGVVLVPVAVYFAIAEPKG
jgi:hypothetical protein